MATVILASCASLPGRVPTPEMRTRNAATRAQEAGFKQEVGSQAAQVPVAAWLRGGHPDLPLRVYIEGDGLAFLSRRERSPDPTPKNPIGLRLAAQDPYAGHTLYLGRPCQYTPTRARDCDPMLWTAARFGLIARDQTNGRLEGIQSRLIASGLLLSKRIELVGFSGGGVLAALIAAERTDVSLLTTVASPLDVDAWTNFHNVAALAASLSPMQFLEALSQIPQIHFASHSDQRVPVHLAERYVAALRAAQAEESITAAPPIQLKLEQNLDHPDWPAHWPPRNWPE